MDKNFEYLLARLATTKIARRYACRALAILGNQKASRLLVEPKVVSRSWLAQEINAVPTPELSLLHQAIVSMFMVLYQIEYGAMAFSMEKLIKRLKRQMRKDVDCYRNLTEYLRLVPHTLFHLMDSSCFLLLKGPGKPWDVDTESLPTWANDPTIEAAPDQRCGIFQLNYIALVLAPLTQSTVTDIRGHLIKVMRVFLELAGVVRPHEHATRHQDYQPLLPTESLVPIVKEFLAYYIPTISALLDCLTIDEKKLLCSALLTLRPRNATQNWYGVPGAPKGLIRGIAYAMQKLPHKAADFHGMDLHFKPLAMELSHLIRRASVWSSENEILFVGILSVHSLNEINGSDVCNRFNCVELLKICKKLFDRALALSTPCHPWDTDLQLVKNLHTGRQFIANEATELD